MAYSDGIIGHVVTAEQVHEGGYEADESPRYFGLSVCFTPEPEGRVKQGIVRLVAGRGKPMAAAAGSGEWRARPTWWRSARRQTRLVWQGRRPR